MKAYNPVMGLLQYFVDKCLPFGSSISCALFQRLSDALTHLAEYKSGKKGYLTNYLDDFLFLARLLSECNALMRQFLELCNEVGFPISTNKTVWASLQVVFLGILMNGQTFTLSIPLEKRQAAQDMIKKMLSKRKVTVKELQQLCGYLNFLTRVIVPGRTFTRHMYSKYAEVTSLPGFHQKKQGTENRKQLKPHYHVNLDAKFRLDCEV